jgi:CheY-like chemotaxis protein
MSLFKKILLVDDDEDSNFLTKRIIVRSNIADEVATALNGKEAFEVVRKCKEKNGEQQCPDLVLLDIKMPVMNGIEFLQVCQASNLCNFPVVILTSSVDETDKEVTTKFPFVKDYINKPFTYEKMMNIKSKLSKDS